MDPDERKKIVHPDSSNFIDYHKIIIFNLVNHTSADIKWFEFKNYFVFIFLTTLKYMNELK